MIKDSVWNELDDAYEYDYPQWLTIVNTRRVKVNGKPVTADDVLKYFSHYHNSWQSSFRSIGPISGDWRPIDELAHELLGIFKITCKPYLRNRARKEYEMELKG